MSTAGAPLTIYYNSNMITDISNVGQRKGRKPQIGLGYFISGPFCDNIVLVKIYSTCEIEHIAKSIRLKEGLRFIKTIMGEYVYEVIVVIFRYM